MTWLIVILAGLAMLYLLACMVSLLLLRRLVFLGSGPLLFPRPHWEHCRTTLIAKDGTTLSGWEIHQPDKHGPPVVYFGGNAEQVGLSLDEVTRLDARWIAAYSYRGYGMSAGWATFANTVEDGRLIVQRLATVAGCASAGLVVMGRSLGAAVATQVAATIPVGGVILVSPFSSLAAMVARMAPWFPRPLIGSRFDSAAVAVRPMPSALLILVEDDEVIPWEETKQMYLTWNGPKTLLRIARGGHNGLHQDPAYLQEIDRFLVPPGHRNGHTC